MLVKYKGSWGSVIEEASRISYSVGFKRRENRQPCNDEIHGALRIVLQKEGKCDLFFIMNVSDYEKYADEAFTTGKIDLNHLEQPKYD